MNWQKVKGLVARSGISVLSVAVGLLLSLLWRPSNEANFLLLVAAVMVSAWYGGLGAALLATVLAVLTSSYFLLPPLYTLNLTDSEDVGHLGLFILVAVFISTLHQKVRSAQRRAEALAVEREAVLAREQEARVKAEAAARERDEFIAVVSHELRSPVNAVLGWSEMLKRFDGSDRIPLERALGAIARNARVMSHLIDDLLDTSRITTGKFSLDLRPIELSAVIYAAIDIVRPEADAKQIQLQVRTYAGENFVSGDPNRLQQAVWNLLTNAIKFTPRGGHVEVHLHHLISELEITVHDNGKGIRPEFLPYVFDRFSQSDRSSAHRQGGLGLGLAITRQVVELHRGTIEVESPGESHGSTFRIKLPALTNPPAHLAAKPEPMIRIATKGDCGD